MTQTEEEEEEEETGAVEESGIGKVGT